LWENDKTNCFSFGFNDNDNFNKSN
jgi:hypothetical protein